MKHLFKLISTFLVVMTLLTASLVLSGCGLKGPLYYPPSDTSASVAAQLFLFNKMV